MKAITSLSFSSSSLFRFSWTDLDRSYCIRSMPYSSIQTVAMSAIIFIRSRFAYRSACFFLQRLKFFFFALLMKAYSSLR